MPVRIGSKVVEVEVRGGVGTLPAGEGQIEIDPERFFLDPVRSNGVR